MALPETFPNLFHFYTENPRKSLIQIKNSLIKMSMGSGLELVVFLFGLYDLAHSRVMNPQVTANIAEGITVLYMCGHDRTVSFKSTAHLKRSFNAGL
jgi:hypothetical protein